MTEPGGSTNEREAREARKAAGLPEDMTNHNTICPEHGERTQDGYYTREGRRYCNQTVRKAGNTPILCSLVLQGPPLSTSEATRELHAALSEIERLMATPQRQEQAIEIWESLWHERVPETGQRAAELATAITGMERPLNEEELAEIAPLLADIADLLRGMTTERAPNPDLVAIWYLRRIEGKLDELLQEGR